MNHVAFPLTPALSPRERENCSQPRLQTRRWICEAREREKVTLRHVLPLRSLGGRGAATAAMAGEVREFSRVFTSFQGGWHP